MYSKGANRFETTITCNVSNFKLTNTIDPAASCPSDMNLSRRSPRCKVRSRKTFGGHSATTDLTCIQCRLDGTVPFQKQNSVYTHSQLNKHLKSNYHSRREQVRRAFIIDKDDKNQCKCPCCPDDDEKTYRQRAFLAHMESDHEATMNF